MMNNNNEPTAIEPTVDTPVQIFVRLRREEIDECKAATGATADATAVACFVRKNLSRGA